MDLTLPVYQDRTEGGLLWITLGLGPHTCSEQRRTELQVQQAVVQHLRGVLRKLRPAQLAWFGPPLDVRLRRLRLELTLHGEGGRRKRSGLYPVVVETRHAGPGRPLVIAYHPARQQEWFPVRGEQDDGGTLPEQAALYFQRAWGGLLDWELDGLVTAAKDSIRPLSFHAEVRGLSDELPESRRGLWDDLLVDPLRGMDRDRDRGGGPRLLPRLGHSLTARAIDGSLHGGAPRSPYREQLQLLLCGARKQPVVLVGPPGCGKTTLIHRWVYDLLDADDYPSHRNLDRAHTVYSIAGRRLIAGMSYVGDWQQRCLDLLEDVRGRRIVVHVEDLHLFGRLGRTRDSDSHFAQVLRGPVSRGELVLVGECTHEQLQRLTDDAPSFAAQLTVVPVLQATPPETLRMLLQEGRRLEARHGVQPQPAVYRSVLELSSAYLPGRALPGTALDLLRALMQAEDRAGNETEAEQKERARGILPGVDATALLRLLSQRTGLPLDLLSPERTLVDDDLAALLGQHVIGQDEAVQAAVDLVLRIKAGVCDPGRPCGVYLFTGPTGVGKTELSRCIAEVLYGGAGRLLRIDMGEYGGPDAVLRLLGDGWDGEGALTRPVQEQPFCVVLLDEIEKAHQQVLHLLLQLLDEGRLTDGAGRLADFTQAVVIMTSNLGARARAAIGFGENPGAVMHEVARAVREFFPPELFNRIDRIVAFRPISVEVAADIARKEVRRLLLRRGLSDRNVFVAVDDQVVARLCAEAFDARDGARSLKRHIEDRLGGLLAEDLAGAPPAALRTCHVSLDPAGGLRASVAPITEAEPLHGGLPLEPLLHLPARQLRGALAEARGYVEGLLDGDELVALGQRMREHLQRHHQGQAESTEQVYHLDHLRLSLEEFRQRLLDLHDGALLDDAEELELYRFGHYHTTAADEWSPPKRYRLFDRRAMHQPLRRAGRDEILECLAEARFLRRALGRVGDPDEHAVLLLIDLPLLGAPRPGEAACTLGVWLASFYQGERGEIDGLAVLDLPGQVQPGWEQTPFRRLALKLVGLGVRDAFRHEHGCHVWRSLARESPPELCRVRVLPAPPGRTPLSVIQDEAAWAPGLLPLVRTLRCDPGGARGVLCEVEDYVIGFSGALQARDVGQVLAKLFLLRTGREEAP